MPQNNTPQSTSLLGTPGDLIANIPGILGFFPIESVVFTAMFREGPGARYSLGPVIRIDINELHLLRDVGRAIDSVNPDLIFCFAITEKATGIAIEEVVDTLFTTAEAGTIDITACWITTGIYSGETYQLAFGPAPEELNHTCQGLTDWEHGRIAPVTQAAATQNMLDQGQLPEINRSDAYAAFDRRNRFLTDDDITELAAQAKQRGDDILGAVRNDPSGGAYTAALEEFESILECARAPRHRNSVRALLQRPGLLRDAAAYLTSVLLRDSILHHCVNDPRIAADLFLAVAKTFDGTIRNNALCLYTIAVIKLNLGMKAIPALDASLATDAEHSFSGLLRHGLIDGQFDPIVDACLRGNEMVRAQYSPGAAKSSHRAISGEIPEMEAGPDLEESEPAEAA